MVNERAQRRIERLLDDADQAADREDWSAVPAAARARATAGPLPGKAGEEPDPFKEWCQRK